jgi:hypothetical protein
VNIFTIRRDGTGLAELPLTVTGFNGAPAYSPDGAKIAFDQDAGPSEPTVHGIFVANADGSEPHRVTTGIRTATAYDTNADWSPDGSRLSFTRVKNSKQAAIYVVKIDGSGLKRLTPWKLDAALASWAPDGSKLVFESYFDTIPHERLLQRVEERISDGRILGLLRSWLDQDIMRDMARWTPTEGTPQGSAISPLLANIYLHPLDELMAARGYRMVRYADDFVVLCKSREEADAALAEIRAWVADNGLRLHPDKTHVGDCRLAGQGFEFLGYRFDAGRRFVRKKSLNRLKDSIRAKTRRTRGDSLARVVADLNRTLRGWFAYFKHAHPRTFIVLDKLIRRRLRSLLRKQEKRPGFGATRDDHQRWPIAFFADAGLLALHTAWRNARYSR